MKYNTKNLVNNALLAILFMGLSSCANPFNLKAINDVIADLPDFFGKTSAEVVSGSSQTATTGGGYKVTSSLGGLVTQPSFVTPGGYRVYSTVQTTK